MTRDRVRGAGALVPALLKQAVNIFGPPSQWNQREVAAWLKRQVEDVNPTREPFDPRAAQTGEKDT